MTNKPTTINLKIPYTKPSPSQRAETKLLKISKIGSVNGANYGNFKNLVIQYGLQTQKVAQRLFSFNLILGASISCKPPASTLIMQYANGSNQSSIGGSIYPPYSKSSGSSQVEGQYTIGQFY